MQLDQLGNRLDLLVGEVQCLHPLAGQLGAHHIVVVEAHLAAGLEAAGGRLSDVVQQGRQPIHEVRLVTARALQLDRLVENGQGVLVHVLVPIMLVPLHL